MTHRAPFLEESPDPARRYRLQARRVPTARLRVTDLSLGTDLADWRGPVAHRLLDCDLLPASLKAGSDCYGCKSLIQRLALLAARHSMIRPAVARTRLADRRRPCALARRLRNLHLRLTSDEHSVASLLYGLAGKHLSTDDVTCLLGLRNAPVTERRVDTILRALANKQVVQRLPVRGGPTFYDVDTRPHLHIYDRDSNTLRDADVHGIVEAKSAAAWCLNADATITIEIDAANEHT